MPSVEYEAAALAFWTAFFDLLARWSALALLGFALLALLWHRSVAIRYRLVQSLLVLLPLLPLLRQIGPPRPTKTLPQFVSQIQRRVNVVPVAPVALRSRFPLFSLAFAVYSLGALLLLARLALALRTVRRLRKTSLPLEFRLLHGFAIPPEFVSQIRVSHAISVPVTCGLFRCVLLLPNSWPAWSSAKLALVLTHELEHLRRRDPTWAVFSALLVPFFWIHPFVWLLRSELASLAEYCCDDAVLRIAAPAPYAEVLLDFAAIPRSFPFVASPAASHSRMRRRLHRLFAPRIEGRTAPIYAALLLVALPALYLAASVRFANAAAFTVNTPAAALEAENSLRHSPYDRQGREALVIYYVNTRNGRALRPHLLYLVEHFPESPFTAAIAWFRSDWFGPPDLVFDSAWERALRAHPHAPAVLSNAAYYLQASDPSRALDLFTRANALAPDVNLYLHRSATIYAAALLTLASGSANRNNPSVARQFARQLQTSGNPALLNATGTLLTQLGTPQQARVGLRLIERAISLAPNDPRWHEALDSALAEPVRRRNVHEMVQKANSHR